MLVGLAGYVLHRVRKEGGAPLNGGSGARIAILAVVAALTASLIDLAVAGGSHAETLSFSFEKDTSVFGPPDPAFFEAAVFDPDEPAEEQHVWLRRKPVVIGFRSLPGVLKGWNPTSVIQDVARLTNVVIVTPHTSNIPTDIQMILSEDFKRETFVHSSERAKRFSNQALGFRREAVSARPDGCYHGKLSSDPGSDKQRLRIVFDQAALYLGSEPDPDDARLVVSRPAERKFLYASACLVSGLADLLGVANVENLSVDQRVRFQAENLVLGEDLQQVLAFMYRSGLPNGSRREQALDFLGKQIIEREHLDD